MTNGSQLSVTQALQGKQGLYSVGTLKILVIINDARLAYGRTDVLIVPVNGSGEQWIESSRVIIS